jgi:hypothetical protein
LELFFRLKISCLVLAALAALSASNPVLADSEAKQAGNHPHSAQSNAPTDPAPRFPAKVAPVAQEQTNRLNQQAQAPPAPKDHLFGLNAEGWTAAFTAVLTGATILMWFSTERNAKAAVRAAKVAERALTGLERPYLIVDFGEAWGLSYRNGQWLFGDALNYKVTNLGRAPAILKRYYARGGVAIHGVLNPISSEEHPGTNFPDGAAVGHGRSEPLSHAILADLDILKLPTQNDMQNAVTFTGFIVYEDLLGTEYTRGFCAACVGEKWWLLGGPAYCYERVKPNDYA